MGGQRRTWLASTVEASCSAAVAALPRNYGTLSRYVMLELIGQGGMGVVWRAYDPTLDRRVALKLIVPTPDARGQIVSEAQALARVQHANVVTVFDAGVQQAGDHEIAFVAMELVEGCTLKRWLEEPSRSPRERLEMFMLAGRGLEAAHAAGLVHRDFKPSNVLIGDDGRVRVADFGLALLSQGDAARALEPRDGAVGVTMLSPLAGTPRYMSPEQLNGLPADARSDQFAFCVALYEAIFGAHPFGARDDATLSDLRVGVLRTPTPPVKSRAQARLAAPLLKGLSRDPAGRWGSMRELLSALDAAGRRRGRRIVLGAAVAWLVVFAAALGWRAAAPPRACRHVADRVGATWSADRQRTLEAAFAALGSRGTDVWSHVAPTIGDWVARWRTLRVEECEADRNGARPSPALTARRECLERRQGELEGLVAALDGPDATVMTYAVRAAHGLTPPETCMSVLPAGDTVTRPPNRAGVAEVRARVDRSTALRRVGKQKDGLAEAKRAAADAARIDWAPLTAEAQLELGRASLDVNATAPATDAFYQALWTAEAARDDNGRLEATMGLFKASLEASEYALAARWHETARAIGRHLPAEPTREARLVFDEMRLALHLGEYKRCVSSGEEALRLADRAGPNTPLVVAVLINLARCHGSMEAEDKARAYLERALPMSEKINGHVDAQTASVLMDLGVRERRAHRYDTALAHYHEALAIREATVGPDNPDCASVHNNIGNVLRELKRHDESRRELRRAIDIWTKAWGTDSPAIAVGLSGLARNDIDQGRPADAEPLLRQALEIRRKKRPAGHRDILDGAQLLGQTLLSERKAEALPLLEEAATGLERDGDASPSDRAEGRFWAARARAELGVRRDGALAAATAACKELDTPASRDAFARCHAWVVARQARAGD